VTAAGQNPRYLQIAALRFFEHPELPEEDGHRNLAVEREGLPVLQRIASLGKRLTMADDG
jgi:hypothetical protein